MFGRVQEVVCILAFGHGKLWYLCLLARLRGRERRKAAGRKARAQR